MFEGRLPVGVQNEFKRPQADACSVIRQAGREFCYPVPIILLKATDTWVEPASGKRSFRETHCVYTYPSPRNDLTYTAVRQSFSNMEVDKLESIIAGLLDAVKQSKQWKSERMSSEALSGCVMMFVPDDAADDVAINLVLDRTIGLRLAETFLRKNGKAFMRPRT
ncbi:MAG: hypothetical protein Q9227_001690 [Pyrenula ochraceoflavens]